MANALRFDLDRLPAEGRGESGTRIVGVFLMVFACFWGGMPTLILIRSLLSGSFEPTMLFTLIFTVIGTALFLTGLWLTTRRVSTTIHADRIEQSKRSIFGRHAWSEPLSAFPGVAYRSEYHSGGKNSSSYTLYIVELHHADKKKQVVLYSSKSDHGVRKVWEDCCRHLGLPALEDDGGVMRARAAEDLDKSVKELAAEGKIEVKFDPTAPPPSGVSLKVEQGKLRIEVKASPMPIWGALIALSIPAVFIYLGFFGPAPMIFGFFGTVFAFLFGSAVLWNLFTHEVIELDQVGVRLLRTSRWGDTKGQLVKADAVESVTIASDGGGQQKTVRIQTDQKTHKAGAGLKEDALGWLRDCVLTVLTR